MLLPLFAAVALAAEPVSLPPARAGAVRFGRDVAPIFEQSCYACHGPAKQRGGLRLDSRAALMDGGNSGPAVVVGAKAVDSKLLHVVGGLDAEMKMPPQGTPLTGEQVATLRAWIEQGAAYDTATAIATDKPTAATHWAFQPVKPITPPTVADAGRNGIDQFVRAKLAAEGVAPSPEADKPTLLRRLCFDLLGLPPTAEQVGEFLADQSPDAYERLADRLLASPHYGERWGRHWLDAARYADSDGFEKDTGRPWAWRYRQWVIDALNADLPYDRFAVQQLAGDLLPDATEQTRIATGFHRNTLTNREGGTDAEQFRTEQVIDRVNTTAKVFLGLTLACAQCHDHKYDPLSHRDYYGMYAFFNNDDELDIDAPLPGEAAKLAEKEKAWQAKRSELNKAVEKRLAEWESTLPLPEVRKLPAAVREAVLKEPGQRSKAEAEAVRKHATKADPATEMAAKAVADHAKAKPLPSKAPTLAATHPRPTRLFVRGDFLRPGVAVTANTPAVLPTLAAETPTRLDLARWVAAPTNPLTARVLVNWLWHHHFGRGLVPTLEDFGTQGERPSHPELLDWLAGQAVEQRWSLKALHKLIVTSATYRQSSAARPDLRDRDPLNVWLARQNRLRLEGESVRDLALAASGLLDRTVGGPSVRPPQPAGISDLTYAGNAKWVTSTGPDRYRRGLYTWFQRTSPYPMLMTFDAPDSNVACVRRERSNTPLQALTLLNDPAFVECSQALAKRVQAEAATDADRVRRAAMLCLGRTPADGEVERMLAALAAFRRETDEAGAWAALARVVLNLDEAVTRE